MTCSARLPVYAVIIAAVIPSTTIGPGIGLQGLVLFALYLAGIVGAMVVALVLRHSVAKGAASGFIMEMPRYQLPASRTWRSVCGSAPGFSCAVPGRSSSWSLSPSG